MPFAVKSTLERIDSYLKASGYFRAGSQVGEPKGPPQGEGLFGAVFMRNVGVNLLYLNGGTQETHSVTVRVYRDMLAEPTAEIEYEVAECVQKLVSDLIGDFDLGATIREVDVAGANGAALRTEWGYVDIGGTMYRVADIQLPLIVDDSGTAAP